MGRFDSSLTRVQPVFGQLIEADRTGVSWLPQLLQAAPFADRLRELAMEPGELIARVSEIDRRTNMLRCFEHPVRPTAELLRWLILHPEDLHWPKGAAGTFGSETEDLRLRLKNKDLAVQEMALAGLDELGPEGSRRKWWAFEGTTKVDCWLETDRLVVFIEGKRTEPLSGETAWLPARNQLIRNLDLVGPNASGKRGFVLLAVENLLEDPTNVAYEAAAPHLAPHAFTTLSERYLGQLRWATICEATGLVYDDLPHEV